MNETATIYVCRDIPGKGECEFELTVHGDVEPYVAGRLYGPPEKCYPAEGGYATLTGVFITVDGVKKRWTGKLTSREEDMAEETLYEMLEDYEPDPPSRDDFDDHLFNREVDDYL